MANAEKLKIEGLGDFEITEEGFKALGEKALSSMKDSHDQAVGKANELVLEKQRREATEQKLSEIQNASQATPSLEIADDDFLQGKDVKQLVTAITKKIQTDLQPTQDAVKNLSSSVIESQFASIKSKRPDLPDEDIRKVVDIRQNYRTDLMRSLLLQQGYAVPATPEDMALYIYEGIQKGFSMTPLETTGIQKQGVRTSELSRNTEDEQLSTLGFSDKDIVEIKQLCRDTKMTIKEWLEHHHPVTQTK